MPTYAAVAARLLIKQHNCDLDKQVYPNGGGPWHTLRDWLAETASLETHEHMLSPYLVKALTDMDRALCWITGEKIERIVTLVTAVQESFKSNHVRTLL